MTSLPYCGPPPEAAALAESWNTDPWLLAALALLAGLALRTAQPRLALAGVLVLVLAFVSPLCALTTALFSARALHHLLLGLVAAPLLAASLGPGPRLRAGPPLLSLLAFSAALIAWHLPPLYSLAWQGPGLYWLMQILLLLPAVLFWAGCFAQTSQGGLMSRLGMILALSAVMGMIGAVLTFAPRPLYPEHEAAPLLYGLLPLEDQQLAGLLMWVPGFVPMILIAGLMLAKAWKRAGDGTEAETAPAPLAPLTAASGKARL